MSFKGSQIFLLSEIMHPALAIGLRLISAVLITAVMLAVVFLMGLISAYYYVEREIPMIGDLKYTPLQKPLQIFSEDNQKIAEIGEIRRTPITYGDTPKHVVRAFISAEDDRFFQHIGIDYHGVIRAVYSLVLTGEKGQGGSTITQQLARNLFLSSEKTYKRKIIEVFLSFKIERELSKENILELYLNKIYLGNRAYGIQAAAHVYFGKNVDELTLAQAAMIAGLPKAPSKFNPVVNPDRALVRRNYVLRRMRELGHITVAQFETAINEEISSSLHALKTPVEAPFVAEMVRLDLVKKYDKRTYEDGYTVYTTIRSDHQKAANDALRKALLEYDRRHGYRGPAANKTLTSPKSDDDTQAGERDELLNDYRTVGNLVPGWVVTVHEKSAKIYLGDGIDVLLDWDGIKWARPWVSDSAVGPAPRKAGDVFKVGDIIYLESLPKNKWMLAQVPAVSGAIVAMDAKTGAITALAGGFDYYDTEKTRNGQFNRATLAKRQPGSSFKPFIYSAALEKGLTPATIINDAPIQFSEADPYEKGWNPQNFEEKFFGETRLREALTKSRNLVAIRILQQIGTPYAIEYSARFGMAKEQLTPNLSLALGSSVVTPMQMATAYSVFANGGFKVSPYFIAKIDKLGREGESAIYREEPLVACSACEANPGAHTEIKKAPRVLPAEINYQMVSMMRDVVKAGTARRAYVDLKRTDLAGKTGTTNEQKDAWFTGFGGDLVCIVWIGFDDHRRSLGPREYGGTAALPMWIYFMEHALKGKPEVHPKVPPTMVTVKIDPLNGLLATAQTKDAIFETFRANTEPKNYSPDTQPGLDNYTSPDPKNPGSRPPGAVTTNPEEIFN